MRTGERALPNLCNANGLITNSEHKKGACRWRERILEDAHLAWHAEPEERQQLRTG